MRWAMRDQTPVLDQGGVAHPHHPHYHHDVHGDHSHCQDNYLEDTPTIRNIIMMVMVIILIVKMIIKRMMLTLRNFFALCTSDEELPGSAKKKIFSAVKII